MTAGATQGGPPAGPRQVWLADWSDEEQAQFEAARSGVVPDVLRSRALGATVGSRWHRLRSWPAYAGLAVRGRRRARGGVLVAWQPLAGALALLLPGPRPPVVILNPILHAGSASVRQRAIVALLRRADQVVFYSSAGRRDAIGLGLPADRTCVLALGTAAATDVPPPTTTGLLLAAGRDHRDWAVLAQAARLSGLVVHVAGPDSVPEPLELLRPDGRTGFADLLAASRAVVVPLLDGSRQAGTLAVLDALAAGRPVIATAGPGTEDYVDDSSGVLVAPGDARALAEALRLTSVPDVLDAWAVGARAAAARLSLPAFLTAVDELAQAVVTLRS